MNGKDLFSKKRDLANTQPYRNKKPHRLPPLEDSDEFKVPESTAPLVASTSESMFRFDISEVHAFDVPNMRQPSALHASNNPQFKKANAAPPRRIQRVADNGINNNNNNNNSNSNDQRTHASTRLPVRSAHANGSSSHAQVGEATKPFRVNALHQSSGMMSLDTPHSASGNTRLQYLKEVILPDTPTSSAFKAIETSEQQSTLGLTDFKHSAHKTYSVAPNDAEDIAKLKTGEDAIAFFSKAGKNAAVKFVYLNRAKYRLKFRPYDLVVVQQSEREPEHFTMSASGVAHIQPGCQTEIVSLSDWMRESTLFNVLTRISFFKHYLVGKAFRTWRKNVRFKKYCNTRKVLTRDFFVAKPTFCPTLTEIIRLCEKIRNTSLMSFVEDQKCYYLTDVFLAEQEKQRAAAAKTFENIIDNMEALLVKLCDSVTMRARVPDMNSADNIEAYLMGTMQGTFDEEAPAPGKRSKSMVEQQQEQAEKARALKKAMAEAEMLGDFICLVDYMAAESLVAVAINTVRKFMEILKDERKTIFFQVTLKFEEVGMGFKPTGQQIIEMYRTVTEELVNTVAQVPRLLYMRPFKMYFDNKESMVPAPWNVGSVIRADDVFNQLRAETEQLLHNDFNKVIDYSLTFEGLRVWYLFGEKWDSNEYAAREHTVREFTSDLEKVKKSLKDLLTMQVSKELGVLYVESKNLRNNLVPVMTSILEEIKNTLMTTFREKCTSLQQEFQTRVKIMQESPDKLHTFAQYVDNLNKIKEKSRELMSAADEVDKMFALLHENKVDSTEDEVLAELLKEVRDQFLNEIVHGEAFTADKTREMTKTLDQKIENMNEELLTTMANLRSGDYVRANADPKDVLAQLELVSQSIASITEKATTYTQYQILFNIPCTEWTNLQHINKQYEARKQIWSTLDKWNTKTQEWNTTPIEELDVEKMNKKVMKYFQLAFKLHREYNDEVTQHLKNLVEDTKRKMPVILMLGNKALEQRHWEKIFEAFGGRKWSKDNSYTLEQLFAYKAFEHKDVIMEQSAIASGERGLVELLKKIESGWAQMEFVVKPHRDYKDIYIIGSVDDISQLLEDNQVTLQSMMASPFIAGIKDQVDTWDRNLRLMSEVLEEWLTCQKNWMYLEFIFSSEDIKRQLPDESSKFASVDKDFKEIMRRAHINPNVLKCTTEEGVLAMFVRCNAELEKVQKSLEDYLETKRVAFPRFYFLSNDELLEILSQTREPRAVQPHLRKCFDSIMELMFKDESSPEILGMVSAEHEKVPFSSSVYAKGNVEHWLLNIESMMRVTLYDVMKECLKAYHELPREEWFSEYPAQCVLTVDQIIWTQQVTQALYAMESGEKKSALVDYKKFFIQQIDKMVELVRGDLTSLQRKTLGALIVIDVHARDVIEHMIDVGVTSPNDFEWTMQLRYYWEEEADNCTIRQANSSFLYGYEYLGNQPRLVITPLTDRCYLTCTGALHLNLGASPQGPAGTGKTESVKDLSKALGRQVVVFNCSEGLNYKMMGRMFSGLAQAGAWACFDEFNRIDIEVLSVIAQQMRTIQRAIILELDHFLFEGRDISLNPNYGVFITMNPGYAGRTELPDNLKALFRPVSMMIPDYALIAEIMLFSEGFSTAKSLAQKMVQLFKLASEQLSKQDHYDFGMRAVKSILVMAGALKRGEPSLSEEIVLIRAMRDSNVPKFLEDDVTLFMAIVQDLFPGVKIPNVDYGKLQKAIETDLRSTGLQIVPSYTTKVIQLYETMVVRHGVMLVGATGTGKTVCYRTLQNALTQLQANGVKHPTYQKVHTHVMNPKSVSMGELYGEFNTLTHEWTDGLIAKTVRETVLDKSNDKHWVVFDGPVDALWIENMNTVLDDNKMLCLVNGERIKVPSTVTMLFEVQDLAVASPATVSRCGMVYLEKSYLEGGWRPQSRTWAAQVEQKLPGKSARIIQLLDHFVDPTLEFIRSRCKEFITSVNSSLVMSLLHLLNAFLAPAYGIDTAAAPAAEAAPNKTEITESKAESELQPEAVEKPEKQSEPGSENTGVDKLIDMYFILSYIWSLGGNVDDLSRAKFDRFARDLITQIFPEFPKTGSVYDYYVDHKQQQFVPWQEQVPEFKYDPAKPFFNILVPTVDTTRFKYLLNALVSVNKNVLLSGVTGVGKTVLIKDFLRETLKAEDPSSSYASVTTNFSARTTSKNLQDIMETKLDKKRKFTFGAPSGKKMIMFIDDLNMPQLEEYGAQPPIELLRQTIDQGGFYDRKKLVWSNVVDTMFIAACGPPGGGRNPITPRLLRHFHLINVPSLSHESMRKIFYSILHGFLTTGNFTEELSGLAESIVDASVEIYTRISQELLPTPSKSHYTFNLRDLSKVIQGILQIKPRYMQDKDALLRLWCHEGARVFHDRLIDKTDKSWFYSLQQELLKKYFDTNWQTDQFSDVLFGDYLTRDEKEYQEIKDTRNLSILLQDYLTDFSVTYNKEVNLVFFKDAIHHLSRICRILRQPRGNALLVGVGGSGRQSLTRLAAFMADCKCFQIEISRGYGLTEFRDDLRAVLLEAGCEDKPVVFLFSDTQIVTETFLEDINSILNVGEVPNLFGPEDMERILTSVRPKAKEAGKVETKDVIYSHFIQLVRENLHIVLSMSPIGDAFRNRIRMFPSLVNNCTIDWYNEWPTEALQSVATRFFDSLPISESLKESAVHMCVHIHTSVNEWSKRYYEELRRHNYTTPTSYIELINLYTNMLEEQREIVDKQVNRLKGGLDKLLATNEMVKEMKIELKNMQPVLEQSAKDTADLLVELKADQKQADEIEQICAKEAQECQIIMDQTAAIRDDCQADLDKAMPAYHAAVEALKTLNKNDIGEIKTFKSPPPAVVNVMEAVSLLMGAKPKWDDAIKLMADTNFLNNLMNYKKDKIPEKTLRELQRYINDAEFDPEFVEKKSRAAKSLCMWVIAIDTYAKVANTVEPKKEKLREAEASLQAAQKVLEGKQAKLAEIQARVAQLKANYEASVKKKENLEKEIKQTELRLERAEKLVDGLRDERVRWQQSVQQLELDKSNLVGNVLLAAGAIAYLGPFTSDYRKQLLESWAAMSKKLRIPVAENFKLESITDPVKIREWNLNGLPADPFSIENGILVTRGRRWPLMIDPQGQANKWLKRMERDNKLKVIKLSDPNFLRTLENSIRVGIPVLLENVGEQLDPSLEPILLKQTYRQGGRLMISIGGQEVDYNPKFRFYITTKLPNPHYMPEICVKVTIINFTVTPIGLEDQLLADVVGFERPELERQKDSLVLRIGEGRRQLKELEDKILSLLANASGNILDDEVLINTLAESKKTSETINNSVKEAEVTAKQIDVAREGYRSVATRGSLLYFVIADLSGVDPMYQNSLTFFKSLFNLCLRKSEKSDVLEQRLEILLNAITESTYTTICRGLFEKDKLLFSFMIAVQILRNSGTIPAEDWWFFLRGSASVNLPGGVPDCPISWMPKHVWVELYALSQLSGYKSLNLPGSLASFSEQWKEYYDCDDPQSRKFPGGLEVSQWQRLLILKVLREEKIIFAVNNVVSAYLGPKFVESPAFDLEGAFADSNTTTPIIFVLSPGADPQAIFDKFAKEKGYSDRLRILSLGQGQGPSAERMIEQGSKVGEWVLLQNCHLAVSWMPSLEKLMEDIVHMEVHKDFRLWLTSMPSAHFPVPVLQNGIKLTNEPPKGLKANLARSFADINESMYETSQKPQEWKKLLFGLSFFHALIQERRKYGALGWNIPYEWNNSDLSASIKSLQNYIDDSTEIPWKALKYIIGVINYGGRVTDFLDLRCVESILSKFFTPAILDDSYVFTKENKAYHAPSAYSTLEGTRAYIASLPAFEEPSIFGLHQNANITFQQKETKKLLETIISIQPRIVGGGGGRTTDDIVADIADDISSKLPELIDITHAHPDTFAITADGTVTSLGTVLSQEIDRFNKLLNLMRKTLDQLKKAIKGLVVMSSELEKMYSSFSYQKVPIIWENAAYPSLKPLGSWFVDLCNRVAFLRSWLENGPPKSFWISGFYFPQGFLTGVLQTHARRFKIPIDTLRFRVTVLDVESPDGCGNGNGDALKSGPEQGVYIHGLYMEGARWNRKDKCISESNKGELYTPMPIMWLCPEDRGKPVDQEKLYSCPVYKTSSRAGALSTTGLSTNFILSVDIPTGNHKPDHWIQRGVALLATLDD